MVRHPDSGTDSGLSRLCRLSDASVWPGGLTGRALTVLVVGLAGLIHLVLTPEHFAEQPLSGLVFTASAAPLPALEPAAPGALCHSRGKSGRRGGRLRPWEQATAAVGAGARAHPAGLDDLY
jgi:hypothetical protein